MYDIWNVPLGKINNYNNALKLIWINNIYIFTYLGRAHLNLVT